jgi:ribonuclease P protein component
MLMKVFYEADVPAAQPPPEARAWLSGADEHQERAQSLGPSPEKGAPSPGGLMRRFASLRRRVDFARLRQRGRRVSTQTLTLYRSDAFPSDPTSLVGITVNKSIGKAVVRNKLRRRLAAIVHDALAQRRAMRLLVVARPAAATVPYSALSAEIASALGRA